MRLIIRESGVRGVLGQRSGISTEVCTLFMNDKAFREALGLGDVTFDIGDSGSTVCFRLLVPLPAFTY